MNFISNLCSNAIVDALKNLWYSTGLYAGTNWQNYIMIIISFVLMYLAIVKKFEPLLLLPIAFGMFIVNIPGAYNELFGTKGYVVTDTLSNQEIARGTATQLVEWWNERACSVYGGTAISSFSEFSGEALTELFELNNLSMSSEQVIANQGLFYYLYMGVDKVIYPPLIFLGIGAMTDFGPLIARPKSMLIGAAVQLGIFITFVGAYFLFKGGENGYTAEQIAGAIAIIGGADGPTAIYVTKKLAADYLPMIAIAAYSYMALIPIIQKPLMKLFTTEKERKIKMKQARKVSKTEKIVFPVLVSLVVGLLLPSAMPLLGMLMLGNLLKESGVAARLVDTATNALMNTITIFLGVMVGSKAVGSLFLSFATIKIILLGLFAFCLGSVGGILSVKLMNLFSKEKMNPLIGSAGVSAVPMAARISEEMGTKYDSSNHLLMHAMGPNVAGVIGSAIAAGVLLALFA